MKKDFCKQGCNYQPFPSSPGIKLEECRKCKSIRDAGAVIEDEKHRSYLETGREPEHTNLEHVSKKEKNILEKNK